jgi:hypothetical protein
VNKIETNPPARKRGPENERPKLKKVIIGAIDAIAMNIGMLLGNMVRRISIVVP